MSWHGYLLIKQLPPFWTGVQIGQARTALAAIGTQSNTQPCKITHSTLTSMFDFLGIVVESQFNDSELTRAFLVTTIAAGVAGTNEAEVDAWLDFELREHPDPWADSWASTVEFEEGDTSADPWVMDSGFCIAILPDTQYLSAAEFLSVAQWIVAQQAAYDIQAVLHVGDLVETYNDAAAWAGADAAFDALDLAGIPYLVGIGNHDYEGNGYACTNPRDSTWFNTYFPQARYTGLGWWAGGFWDVADSENLYCILTIDGDDYLLMNLEFGPRDAVLVWADGIIAANPGATAIIASHCYLNYDGNLVGPTTSYRPNLFCQCDADSNDGIDMWSDLVKLRANTLAVVCGHMRNDGTARRVTDGDFGNRVSQMLSGHIQTQLGTIWKGFVRLLNIRTADNAMSVRTYAVLDGVWLTDPENKFELSM